VGALEKNSMGRLPSVSTAFDILSRAINIGNGQLVNHTGAVLFTEQRTIPLIAAGRRVYY
jgi:hypothetical protein